METDNNPFKDETRLTEYIYSQFEQNPDGFSLMFDGDEPTSGFMVGQFGSERRIATYTYGKYPKVVEFAECVMRALDTMMMKDRFEFYSDWGIGGFHDPTDDQYVLDIVHRFDDIQDATNYGVLNLQDSIYDVANDSVIELDYNPIVVPLVTNVRFV